MLKATRIARPGRSGRRWLFVLCAALLLVPGAPLLAYEEEPVAPPPPQGPAPRLPPQGPAPAPPAQPVLTVQFGHAHAVSGLAIAGDGRVALSGDLGAAGQGGIGILWDVGSGRELRRLRGDDSAALGVALSRDARLAALGTQAGRVFVHDVATANVRHTLTTGERAVRSVAFSPDGTQLVCSTDAGVHVFDTTSGASQHRIRATAALGHGAPGPVLFSNDGKHFLVACHDGHVRAFDAASGTLAFTTPSTTGRIRSLAISPEPNEVSGTELLAVLADRLTIHDAGTGAKRNDLSAGAPFTHVAFGSGIHVILSSPDHGLIVYRPLLHAPGYLVAYGGETGAQAVAVSPAGKVFLLATREGGLSLRRWDRNGALVGRCEGRALPARQTHFLAGGTRLWVRHAPHPEVLWNVETGARIPVPWMSDDNAQPTIAVAVSPDGSRLLRSTPTSLELRDAQTGAEIRRYPSPAAPFATLAFSPDGKRAASRSGMQGRIFDVATGGLLAAFATARDTKRLVFSPDGEHVLMNPDGHAAGIVSTRSGQRILTLPTEPAPLAGMAYAAQGTRVVTASTSGAAHVYDAATGAVLHHVKATARHVTDLAVSPDGASFTLACSDGRARRFDVVTGQMLRAYAASRAALQGVSFSRDGTRLVTTSEDRSVRIFDAQTGTLLASLVAFEGTPSQRGPLGWAVIDPAFRFDAGRFDQDAGCHWTVANETLDLEQLKDRYYEPQLLAKVMGFNPEPLRRVTGLRAPKLHPEVRATTEDGVLRIDLTNRGGGIGRVVVLLNGKEVNADARGETVDEDAADAQLTVDLRGDPRLQPGTTNRVEVFAYNKEGYLRSRGLVTDWHEQGDPVQAEDQRLYAVVAGVSDYRGRQIDLNFAAKDAEDFGAALRVAANNLFRDGRADVKVLKNATRAQILEALHAARAARPSDALVLYLAGHGVTIADNFHFVTADAASLDLGDPEVRATSTISSAELTEAIKAIPAAKQAVVLDTCASGSFLQALSGQRGVPSSQLRALERMKDRTGMYVLAGCAADRQSYETSQFGQGLLTYSLLKGMRGARLRDGTQVDVAQLFEFAADEVPALAEHLGGVQRPQLTSPRVGASFDIGSLPTADDRKQVPLRMPKQFVARAQFQDRDVDADVLDLSTQVDAELREASSIGADAPWVFVDVRRFPGAYRVSGSYQQTATGLSVRWRLWRDTPGVVPAVHEVVVAADEAAAAIARHLREVLPAPE